MRRRRNRCWLVKERQLLGRRLQPINLQGEAGHAHPSAHTPGEQPDEHRLKICFPTRAMRQSLMRCVFDVVAVPDREPQTPTNPLLLPEDGAESFQQPIQPPEEERIVYFVRSEGEDPFDHRLCGGVMNRRRIDAPRPIMQKRGGRAEHGFQLCERN